MAREQLGVCTEANLHGSYLFFNAFEGHERALRHKIASIPQLFDKFAMHFSESLLTGVIAIGNNYWDILYPEARPQGLAPFPEYHEDDIDLVAIPLDFFVQIRSDRLDVNFIVMQQILQLLQGHAELQEHIQGFRYLDGRNLTGFIDAPLNPKGKARRQAALISSEQPLFAGSSYLHLHCFNFDYTLWQQLSNAAQEEIMGMEKFSGKVFEAAELLPDSYIARTLTAEQGLYLQQNMPFSNAKKQGLLQLNYASDASVLHAQLDKRLGLKDPDNGYEQLLNYGYFDFSSVFFAPSVSFLEQAARV